jgi:hypothetical protein
MSLYRLQSRDLKDLDSNKTVEFFRRLLWAEASRVAVSSHLIDAPDCINVGDGGLDAVVCDAVPLSEDVIAKGSTGFQTKCSDLEPAACRKELYTAKGELKPAIKRLLSNNGTYVLVLFAEIPSETLKKRRELAIIDELKKNGFESPKIRVYTINQLVVFAEKFPALVAWFKNHDIACLPYDIWARNDDVSYPPNFIADDPRSQIIDEIHEILRAKREKSAIIRISGLSGLGKTRLIFESLAVDDLRNSVLYTTASALRNSSQLNSLLLDETQHAILVVDECSAEDHDYLANKCFNLGSRIALITLSNELLAVSKPCTYYELAPMQQKEIETILSQVNKQLARNAINRLAYFAEGYPSFALLLLKNYDSNYGEDYLPVLEIQIKKLMTGTGHPDSDWYKKTRSVLMVLAIFDKLGFNGELASEARYASGIVNVSWEEFQQVVREQKVRRVVQGEYYIRLTPFPLAVYLLREWWEIYGPTVDFSVLFKDMPPELLNRFITQLPFVTAESGKRLVGILLSPSGIFSDGSFLQTERGGDFFNSLTEADPNGALNCLKRTIGCWNKEQLLAFRTGRRQIIYSLEKIAVWKELFSDAANLLLSLAEAENEEYANNATGIFVDLFVPGRGPLAHTEASLEERYRLLTELLSEGSFERKKIVLQAFERALKRTHFYRIIGAEYQGSKRIPQLWTPKSDQELIDHYTRVWTYLNENLNNFSPEIRQIAIKVLINNSRELNTIELAPMIISTLRELSKRSTADKEAVFSAVSLIVHYDTKRMSKASSESWLNLKNELLGFSFSETLARFVKMYLLEDYFHETEKYDTAWLDSKIHQVAQQAVNNLALLETEYDWLVTDKAKNGFQFGYKLATLDKEFTILWKIISKQKEFGNSAGFLNGYLRGVFERDVALWENTLDELSKDSTLKVRLPELTWGSGMTERAADRILSLLESGEIDTCTLGIFQFGGAIPKLSKTSFLKWSEFLLKNNSENSLRYLLTFVHTYYIHVGNNVLDKDLILKVLLHPKLWSAPRNRNGMDEFYWKETASKLLAVFPETGDDIADAIIGSFGLNQGIFGLNSDYLMEVLSDITKKNPEGMWLKITSYLEKTDSHLFYIMDWLNGKDSFEKNDPAIFLFNRQNIWEWVNCDPKSRAPMLATFVPHDLGTLENPSIARELLVKYGNDKSVRDNFSNYYSTNFFNGSAVSRYSDRKKRFIELKNSEKNVNIVKWIDETISSLNEDIERAKINEEKLGY